MIAFGLSIFLRFLLSGIFIIDEGRTVLRARKLEGSNGILHKSQVRFLLHLVKQYYIVIIFHYDSFIMDFICTAIQQI